MRSWRPGHWSSPLSPAGLSHSLQRHTGIEVANLLVSYSWVEIPQVLKITALYYYDTDSQYYIHGNTRKEKAVVYLERHQ